MNEEQILIEIRELRNDIKDLRKEFYIFKGKAFGFLSLLTVLVNIAVDLFKGHR